MHRKKRPSKRRLIMMNKKQIKMILMRNKRSQKMRTMMSLRQLQMHKMVRMRTRVRQPCSSKIKLKI